MRKKLYLAASLGLSVMLMAAGIADYNSSYAKAKFNVKLSRTKVTLAKGKSYKLKVTTIKKAKITFSSSKSSVASVNSLGKIVAKNIGKAKSTVTVKKGKDKVKKVCQVTVTKSKAQNSVTPTAKPTASSTPTATADPAEAHIKKEGDASQLLPNKSEGYSTFAPEIKKATENNLLLTNSYAADPAVMEYDGRIYVYMTNDSQHYEKGNRSDTNSYGYKVFISYLCYGNGVLESNGKNGARIRKLADDMVSFAGPEITIDAPYFFEDSGINKIGDTYYFSYCSNWDTRSSQYSDLGLCSIGYMTSKSPEGPYTYCGDVLVNCGNVFGVAGNNHHSIINYNGKYYMFYHTRVLETTLGSDLGFRSSHVNELTVNADGTLEPVKQDLEGVSQIKVFNPYEETKGITYSDCSGMIVTRYLIDGASMEAVSNADKYQYSWSLIKGADFGETSPSEFTAHFKMNKTKTAKIKVYADKLGGDVIAEADIIPDENGDATVSVPAEKITGTHNIYFAFDGSVLSFEDWKFEK